MSKIDQLNSRPPTHILTTRIDGRYLATLIRFWHKNGELPRSLSELTRLSLESFAEFLILNNKIDFVQSHSDAAEILHATGLSVKKINPKNLAMALASEGANFSPASPKIDSSHVRRTKSQPISSSNPELTHAQAALDSALDSDLKQRIKDEQARTEDFRNNILGIVQGGKK
jgi:hypothetical protein